MRIIFDGLLKWNLDDLAEVTILKVKNLIECVLVDLPHFYFNLETAAL